MMLYLYPEEWTGRRAREVHTLNTCVALARAGRRVTLVTAGGEKFLQRQLREVAGADAVPGLETVALSRALGPVRSAAVFAFHFRRWLRAHPAPASGFTIHLKAAAMFRRAGIPYAFEAHEVFAETSHDAPAVPRALGEQEHAALAGAAVRIATSSALARALADRYALPNDFHVVPNAGAPPLAASVAQADGPFVYLGSIADWKGLEVIAAAARAAQAPLRVVGGSEQEWRALGARCDLRAVSWRARVAAPEIPSALAGARAGLIPTLPDGGAGRYSCPMKLFDYARCGLPVVTTDLPALESLDTGAWCRRVSEPTVVAWTAALRPFRFEPADANAALTWAKDHTWAARAEALLSLLPEGTAAHRRV